MQKKARVCREKDREKCIYCKVAFKEDKIVGCILLGDVKGRSEILSAVEKKVNVKELKSLFLEEGFDFKKTPVNLPKAWLRVKVIRVDFSRAEG